MANVYGGVDLRSPQQLQAANQTAGMSPFAPDYGKIAKEAAAKQRQGPLPDPFFGRTDNAGRGGTEGLEVANGIFGTHNTYDQQMINPDAYRSRTNGLKNVVGQRITALGQQQNYTAANPQTQAVQSAGGQQWQQQGQQQLAQMLFQQAMGQGPSAAQAQLQAGNAAAINAQMAMARSGGNPNAMRGAMFNAAGITQQNANAAAQLRAQEMLAGRQLYGDQLATARGQDIQNQQYNAGMQQHLWDNILQNNQTNAQLNAQQTQARDQLLQGFLDRGMSMGEADRAADMALSGAMIGQNLYKLNTQIGGDANTSAMALDLIKTGVSTGGQILGASLSGKKP